MGVPEATDQGLKIHPSVWGVMGAAIWQGGRMAVETIKGGKKRDRLEEILTGIATIRETMVTRTDLQRVEGKIDTHVQAHAEHRFDQAMQ